MQLDETIIVDIDKLAKQHKTSRQALVNLVLKQAIKNNDFLINLDEI